MTAPFFSICIPNYNYQQYVGRTIASVLAQDFEDFEIVIADNASTDRSSEIIRAFGDPRIKLRVNSWNVGFGGNLDKAAALASGRHMIMLSSDDLMSPGALTAYARILNTFDETARNRVVVTSPVMWIDADDGEIGYQGVDEKFWSAARADKDLTSACGSSVRIASATGLLKTSLLLMRNPLPFASTCYPRACYEDVEGYGGGRLINPDKWFHWKLLSVADTAVLVDAPLFRYRWHTSNQTAQQASSGALKHLVDEYINTFDVPAHVLDKAGVARDKVIGAFVEHDIALRNLERVADGKRLLAWRGMLFGRAAYPSACARNWKVWALRLLLLLGPVGTFAAEFARDRLHSHWASEHGADEPQRLRSK